MLYDPCRSAVQIVGKLYTKTAYAYYNTTVGGGTVLTLERGPEDEKWKDYHELRGSTPRIVAKCSTADAPVMRWKKCFLNSCTSGHYYYWVFNHGTLFYTVETCSSEFTTKAFVKAVIDGLDNDAILFDLNLFEDVNDYHNF